MKCPSCSKTVPKSARFCSFCGQALQGKPTPPDLEVIKKLINLGEYQKALAAFQILSKENASSALLLCWWGHAFYFAGQHEEAASKYRQALEKDPSLWDACYLLASLSYHQGHFQESLAYFEKFLKIPLHLKGHLLAPALGGDSPEKLLSQAHLYMGLALKQLDQADDAIRHLEQAAQLDSQSALAFGVLGDLYMLRQEFPKAVETYQKALERVAEPSSQWALQNDLGVAYFRAGRLVEAAEEFKKVILQDPGNQNALHNLGVLYLKQGSKPDLKQDWQDFLKADQAANIFSGLARSLVEAAKLEGSQPEQKAMLLGKSQAMQKVFDLMARASASTANVIILGENGTGKELVARAIHQNSPRAAKPFVAINCGALPEGLLESELFGHEKGAFTGAYAAKPGRFELAEGGTLFLDEIGDLNIALQVKLLRVIQERSFERLGGTKTLHADVRLIAATHQDLHQKVLQGSFREDLFYRLYVIALNIPPLRQRKEDISLLAQHFLQRYSQKNQKHFEGIHPEALKLLQSHDWPGNVRELENVIERAVALYDDRLLLPSYLHWDSGSASPSTAPDSVHLASPVAKMERDHIVDALKKNQFKVPQAASALGMSRATLYRKLEKYQIRVKSLN